MVNPFAVAKELLKELNELPEDDKVPAVQEAIAVKHLMKMHKHGYENAKLFYIDKEAGWGE
jgi:hypothetical protein